MRKLEHELGIQLNRETFAQDLRYITRILYRAPSCGQWGEHEGTPLSMLIGNELS